MFKPYLTYDFFTHNATKTIHSVHLSSAAYLTMARHHTKQLLNINIALGMEAIQDKLSLILLNEGKTT